MERWRKIRNAAAKQLLRILLLNRRITSRLIRSTTNKLDDYEDVAFAGLEPGDIASRQADNMEKIKYLVPASFISLMNYRTKKKKLTGEKLPEWKVNDKVIGAKLAKNAGFRVPKVHQEDVGIDDIIWRDGSVIKPLKGASSEGVFCYYDENRIWDVVGNAYLQSKNKLIEKLKNINEKRERDRWVVEELITGPDGKLARDIKFYSFYGEVGMVLEVRKSPDKKYCFWSASGEPLDTGKYNRSDLFTGEGFRVESLETAKHLSLEVPAPFVRIDFLDTDKELVFGEFTPRPGGFGLINRRTDTLLGAEFLAAETRLVNDLLVGKKFSHYHQAIKH